MAKELWCLFNMWRNNVQTETYKFFFLNIFNKKIKLKVIP